MKSMLEKLMKDSKEVKLPDAKHKAKMHNIMKLKELAKELLADELGQKIQPEAMEIEVAAAIPEDEMDMEEVDVVGDADMVSGEVMVVEDEEESEDDEDELKKLLKKQKEQDSEY